MKRAHSALAFATGQIAVFDEKGQQIPGLQRPWPTLWADHAERLGYDPQGLVFELQNRQSIRIIRAGDRWSFELC